MFFRTSLFLLTFSLALPLSADVQVSSTLTVKQALEQVRAARKAGDSAPVTIRLPEGITTLTEPILLEAQDSNITFTGEGATLSGAPVVKGWEKHKGSVLKSNISKLLPKGFKPKQLFFAGERQILARYPNLDAADPLYGGWALVAEFPPEGAPEGHEWKKMLYVKPQDIRQWAHPEDVEIDIFAQYGWWNFIEPVQSLDAKSGLLTLKKNCSYDLHPHNRYRFQNALEELDAPGEWFYDRHTGDLYFWPPTVDAALLNQEDLL